MQRIPDGAVVPGENAAPQRATVFVGRARERAELLAAARRLTAGRGELYLITGEAGVGKTRLADEVCAEVAPDLTVLWGRCVHGGGAPAYWPWRQILHAAVATERGRAALDRLGMARAALATIIPDIEEARGVRERRRLDEGGAQRRPSEDEEARGVRERRRLDEGGAQRRPSEDEEARGVRERRRLDEGGAQRRPSEDEEARGVRERRRLDEGGAQRRPSRNADQAGVVGPPEGEHARFYAFDAVRAFFAELAAPRPVVVVLDDLHDAEASSLLLLTFLARELRSLPVLLLCAYRPLTGRRRGEIGTLLGTAAREGRHLRLTGLSGADVATFLAETTGAQPPPALVEQVREATEGNAFFVSEVAPLLLTSDQAAGPLRVPDGVREAIRRRLLPLDSRTVAALEAAAVIGREFSVTMLAHVKGESPDVLLERICEAVEAGIVAEVHDQPGCFRFEPALVHDALSEALSPGERMRLHHSAATALRAVHGKHDVEHLDDLAHHLQHSFPDAARDAFDVTVRAAQRAAHLLAYEHAAVGYRKALGLAGPLQTSLPERCDLLLALGEAQACSGNDVEARESFQQAVELARDLGDAPRLARAALGSGGATTTPTAGVIDTTLVELLTEARAALGSGDEALKAQVTGRLAMERYYLGSRDERDALTREAVELARSSGDLGTLAAALNARHFALWGLEDVEERVAAGTEILKLAMEAGDTDLAMQGHTWRIVAFLEQGDIAAADREIALHARLAEERRQPYHRWNAATFRAMRALLEGRFVNAAALAEDALKLGERQSPDSSGPSVGPNARMMYGVQEFTRLKEEGRLGTIEPQVREFVRLYPTLPVWRCALAYLCLETGADTEARAELDRLAVLGFLDIPVDGNWLVATTLLAEVCAGLGDAVRAGQLYGLLAPYEGRVVVIAQGAACRGAVSHYLGLLAATAGRSEDAVRHFTAALAMHQRLGARAYVAKTRAAWGRHLRAAGAPAHQIAAQLRPAHAAYRELGLAATAGALQVDLQLLGDPVAATSQPSSSPSLPPTAGHATIHRRGIRWTITYEGVVTSLQDAKGLRHLASLLAAPSQEQHAIALDGTGLTTAGTGAALDLNALRERFADLRAEIDEAQDFADHERAALARRRLDTLMTDTAEGAGLGGDQTNSSRSERARINVTRAIKSALRKIGSNDPALGRHLETTVRTGTYCVYRPDPRVPLHWKIDVDDDRG